jgi:hypothetical protein
MIFASSRLIPTLKTPLIDFAKLANLLDLTNSLMVEIAFAVFSERLAKAALPFIPLTAAPAPIGLTFRKGH